MKVYFENEDQVDVISKHHRSVKFKTESLQDEYLRFKKLYKDKFDSFSACKDTYNRFGERSWIFSAFKKSIPFK